MNTGMQSDLNIRICASAQEAIDKGFVYRAPEYKPARLVQAVVVRNGTVEGNATVDLVFEDEDGQKHVVMLTQRLLAMAGSV